MYSIDIKTYPSACDERGNMKLYRVMQAMQDCSELWLQSEPVFRDYFERNGMAQLLAYRQLDILRVPCYAENLRVSTSVYDVNPMFGYRNTCIYDSNNLPCYKSWGMGAFVNRQTGKLQKVPKEVLGSVTMEPPVEMEYTERRIMLPDIEFDILPQIDVMKQDIDYNHHVNNAEYLRHALEFLPADFEIRQIRIEYKVPAKVGDVIIPKIARDGDSIFVVMYIGTAISTIFQFRK
ncbi:MAG: hypothetical protein IJ834_03170 [Paludibacteraceae bacterium]|nr:hypothetical protein [Paludibacteraceae bacterium]